MTGFVDPAHINTILTAIRAELRDGVQISGELNGGNNLVVRSVEGYEANVHLDQFGHWSVVDVRMGVALGDVTVNTVRRVFPARLLK